MVDHRLVNSFVQLCARCPTVMPLLASTECSKMARPSCLRSSLTSLMPAMFMQGLGHPADLHFLAFDENLFTAEFRGVNPNNAWPVLPASSSSQ